MEIQEVVQEIKKKRELTNISDKFVQKLVIKELGKRPHLLKIIKNASSIRDLKRNREFLYFFKEIRKMLHEIYGVFAPKDIKKIWKILESNIPLKQKVIDILRMSRSTKERLNFYSEIYDNIFLEIPKEIIDIASGINPVSIYLSKYKPKAHFFVDISPDILMINEYILEQISIESYGYEMDVFEPSNELFKFYQYIFLWKTIPIIEKYNPGYTAKLISELNFDYLVVSFPLQSLSGRRRLGRAWRPWMYRLVKDLGLKIQKEFETKNE
ncbi:MAG TPA: hypothetical protein EYH22_01285, partial [Candidatus Nanopusillus sp.]|nr:hypothetical protein [Candidatus Nanopusillus sp.]